MRVSTIVVISMLTAQTPGCSVPSRPADADLVLRGGRVVTLDPALPEATALAVASGRIVAVGDDPAIAPWIGPRTRILELDGKLAIPGWVESHGHLVSLGETLARVELGSARSWDEVVVRVAERAAEVPRGTWILGRGWHQDKWIAPPAGGIAGFPVRDRLDTAVPDHPVLLTHASGHAAIANARALELTGLDARTPDPDGGTIARFADGRPTGLLHENAEKLVEDARLARLGPEARRAEIEDAVVRATREIVRHGITTFHDAGATFGTVDVLDRLAAAGRLPVRVRVMLSEPVEALEARGAGYRRLDAHDGRLTVRAIKRWADGALGNRGAWLLEPYDDDPGHVGMPVDAPDELERTARFAAAHGFQLAVHAIGDRANRETLDLFERHLPHAGPDPRWRIEHAQHLDPTDVGRFAELGVIASMQGVHCTSDGAWVRSRLGARRVRQGAYVWRTLLDSGAVIANGTDTPVEPIDPIANFAALIARRLPDGTTLHPEQSMTRREALHASTLAGAYAAFDERDMGSVTPGKRADLTVLSRDILSVPVEEISEAEVVWTIVGGTIVHDASGGGD